MGERLETEELAQMLGFWMDILKLKEWDVKVKICRARDMQEGTAGTINWEVNHKDAFIRLLDPIDYPEDSMRDQDMEETLVHELLHLHFSTISENFGGGKNNEFYSLFEEQAICSIAAGLIKLHRSE